jgi:hypothetical protein
MKTKNKNLVTMEEFKAKITESVAQKSGMN